MLFLQPINESVKEIATADFLAECIQLQLEVMEENEAMLQADYYFHTTLQESEDKKPHIIARIAGFIVKQLIRLGSFLDRMVSWLVMQVQRIVNKFRSAENKKLQAPTGTRRLDIVDKQLRALGAVLSKNIDKLTGGATSLEHIVGKAVEALEAEANSAIKQVDESIKEGSFKELYDSNNIEALKSTIEQSKHTANQIEATSKKLNDGDLSDVEAEAIGELRNNVNLLTRVAAITSRVMHAISRAASAAFDHTQKEKNAS